MVVNEMNNSNNSVELIERDKHHISWKNHGIDQFINTAVENYLQKKEILK